MRNGLYPDVREEAAEQAARGTAASSRAGQLILALYMCSINRGVQLRPVP